MEVRCNCGKCHLIRVFSISDGLWNTVDRQILNMSVLDWHNMYTDLPSRQTKVPVTNKDLITCSDDEMHVVEPAALQAELDSVRLRVS